MYRELLAEIEGIATELKGSYDQEIPKNLSQARHRITQAGLGIVTAKKTENLSNTQVTVLSDLLNMVLHSYMDWESVKRERLWVAGQ